MRIPRSFTLASSASPTRGFALLVALSLMAFILLLLVSLSTLVKVDVQTSAVTRDLQEARQNALFALQVALGDLQMAAGPDQRVTARADILSQPADDWVGDIPAINNPYWTGVWQQNTDSPATPGTYPDPDPRLVTFLVSGMNDKSSIDKLHAARADNHANDNSYDFAGNDLAQIVKADSNEQGGVAVPLVTYDNGGYAFWISDEGVKADVSTTDPYENSPASSTEGRIRVTAAQRFGSERIGVQAGDTDEESFGSLYDSVKNDPRFDNLFSGESLATLTQSDAMNTYLREHIHDTSFNTLGLLTNPWHGGFKVDLSRGLDDDPLTGDIRDDFSPAWDDKPIPQWQLFRSFYNAYQQAADGTVPVRPGTQTQHGYGPIILAFNILNGIQLSVVDHDTTTPDKIDPHPDSGEVEYQLNLVMWFGFALWNPYNVSLEASNYLFDAVPLAYTPSMSLKDWPKTNDGSDTGREITFQFRDLIVRAAERDSNWLGDVAERYAERVRVGTANPVSFAPGEIKVFSTQPQDVYYVDEFNFGNWLDLSDNAKNIQEGYLEEEYIAVTVGWQPGDHGDVRDWRNLGRFDVNGDGELDDEEDEIVAFQSPLFTTPPGSKLINERQWDGRLSASDIGEVSIDRNSGQPIYNPISGEPEFISYYPVYFRQGGNPGLAILTADGRKLHSVSSGHGNDWDGWKDSSNPLIRLAIPGAPIGVYGSYSFPTAPKRNNTWRILADMDIRTNTSLDLLGRREDGRPWGHIGGISWTDQPASADPKAWVPLDGVNGVWGISEVESRGGQRNVVIFDVPREQLVSIGQFQHLNLRPESTQAPDHSNQALPSQKFNRTDSQVPTFQVGNSRVNMWTEVDLKDFVYRVNESLWDDYFFSSIPAGMANYDNPFLNQRITFVDFDQDDANHVSLIRDKDAAASKLGIKGAFNVNSTSVEAWKAALASLNGLVDRPEGGDFISTFPGMDDIVALDGLESDNLDTSSVERVFEGFRALTEAELDALAARIVEEVKVRGPFLSLSEFVNRTLEDRDTRNRNTDLNKGGLDGINHAKWLVDQYDTRLKGTLQAAIDGADHNNDGLPDINEVSRQAVSDDKFGIEYEPQGNLPKAQGITSLQTIGTDPLKNLSEPEHPIDVRINRPEDDFDGFSATSDSIDNNPWVAGYGLTTTDAPGFLSQMDILTALGPSLTVRSDTFKIRAYGMVRNPLTNEVESEAWIEAIVQRVPDYVDAGLNAPTDLPGALAGDNAALGRRFVIVSTRWLDESEV